MKNEILINITKRRSCRKFIEEKKISKEIIEKIIEAGLKAPSAMNQQPWFFTVINNKEKIDEINFLTKESCKTNEVEHIRELANNEKYHIFYNAPTVVLVSKKQDAYEAEIDCAAAIENMLLAAESLGIKSCWIGTIKFLFSQNSEKVIEYKKELKVPDGYEPIYAVVLGYSNSVEPKEKKVEVKKFVEIID